jgi:O-antigen/teichoic acid export membrane protein
LVEIACIFYIQIQALYVSTFLPKEDAALFFSAFTLTTIITLFVGAQKQKLIPEILKTSVEVTRKILKSYLINSFILIFLVFVVFCLFGKNILALLYGQVYYQNANYVLLLLTIANFFTATIVIVGSYLTAKNKVHMKTPLQIESIFVAIISLFLFKIYGIYGATYSYIITALYLSIRYIMTVNNEINKELGEKND